MVSAFDVLSFLKNNFINFDCTGSSLLHAGFVQLQCTGFSLPWLLLLQSTGFSSVARGLWSSGSGVEACALSGPEARGIFREQGANLCILYCRADSQPLDHQVSPQFSSRSFIVLGFLFFLHFYSFIFPLSVLLNIFNILSILAYTRYLRIYSRSGY